MKSLRRTVLDSAISGSDLVSPVSPIDSSVPATEWSSPNECIACRYDRFHEEKRQVWRGYRAAVVLVEQIPCVDVMLLLWNLIRKVCDSDLVIWWMEWYTDKQSVFIHRVTWENKWGWMSGTCDLLMVVKVVCNVEREWPYFLSFLLVKKMLFSCFCYAIHLPTVACNSKQGKIDNTV